jgi:hypothetical protein
MTASVFATTLTIPADALAVTEGEPVLGGLHGDIARHNHCDWCKSWVFTRLPAEFGAVNVRAMMLDDPSWFVPFVETQTAEKLAWVTTPAKRSFERFPELPDYPVLIQEYKNLQASLDAR